jgi:CheY-like chemotaxis protein
MMPDLEETPGTTLAAAAEESGSGLRREPLRRSVLVVEDDPAQRAMLLELISLWGYRTVAVGSAEEAEALLGRAGSLEVAVVDVFLPGDSGVQLITRLRERFPDSVLIGISALSTAETARRCKGIGADLFIGKPLEPARLAEALRSEHQSWH